MLTGLVVLFLLFFFVSCELPTCESSGIESSDSQSFQGADGSTVEADLFAGDDLLCRL